MFRVAANPINLPKGVEVTLNDSSVSEIGRASCRERV